MISETTRPVRAVHGAVSELAPLRVVIACVIARAASLSVMAGRRFETMPAPLRRACGNLLAGRSATYRATHCFTS